MSNLIERLYEPCKRWKRCKDTRYEAADEIERLKAELFTMRNVFHQQDAEIERLQKRVSDADECIEEQEEMLEHLTEEVRRLQRAYRPADMIEYQELRAVLDRVANATVLRARGIAREALSYEHS
jgi:DNA repair exonuclease SbcCD ATPase subunit